jgi:hypothetical protein
MRVSEYTFRFFADGPEPLFSAKHSCADDVMAIRHGGELLRLQSQLGSALRSIRIGRGSDETEIKWLGAWDWDGAAHWRPEE